MSVYDNELRRLLCDEHVQQLERSARRIEREPRVRQRRSEPARVSRTNPRRIARRLHPSH